MSKCLFHATLAFATLAALATLGLSAWLLLFDSNLNLTSGAKIFLLPLVAVIAVAPYPFWVLFAWLAYRFQRTVPAAATFVVGLLICVSGVSLKAGAMLNEPLAVLFVPAGSLIEVQFLIVTLGFLWGIIGLGEIENPR